MLPWTLLLVATGFRGSVTKKNIMTKMLFCTRTLRHRHLPRFHDSFLLLSFLGSDEDELSDLFVTLSVNAVDLFDFFFISKTKMTQTVKT